MQTWKQYKCKPGTSSRCVHLAQTKKGFRCTKLDSALKILFPDDNDNCWGTKDLDRIEKAIEKSYEILNGHGIVSKDIPQ
jgi:hypothetical protein